MQEGEITVIMGLSGSGKSTLIRHLNRLIEPTAGQVEVDGEDVLAYGEQQLRQLRRETMSMVFQKFALLPHRTVAANAATTLQVRGVAKQEYLAEAHAANCRQASWMRSSLRKRVKVFPLCCLKKRQKEPGTICTCWATSSRRMVRW